ncbi:MAG: aspartyl protease family protein, partial [Phycisphaeraceae bacterium]
AGLWLIDTGSSLTIVESGVAGRLSLDTSKVSGEVRGIGGMQSVQWVKGAKLDVGDVRLPVERLGKMNFYAINRAVNTPMSGIVGFDALRTSPFTLDPRGAGGELVLHPGSGFEADSGMRSVEMATWSGVSVVRGEFGNGAAGPLVVDTGQDRELTLPASWAVRWPRMFASPQTGPGRSVGVGGAVRGREGWVKSLRALGWEWRDVPVKIEPGAVRGRIGMKLLRQMVLSFDPVAGKLWAKPAG